MPVTRTYNPTTAAELLTRVCELSTWMGKRIWTAQDLEGNPPRAIRHQRIEALLRALGLDPDVRAFLDGEFLARRPVADSAAFLRLARAAKGSLGSGVDRVRFREDLVDPHTLVRVYRKLVAYRLSAKHLLAANGSVLEASGLYCFPVVLTETVNRRLVVELQPIDKALALLVDPDQRRMPRETLVRDYGFPDVDLEALDAEWI